jgi:hypothetical protein
LTKPEAADAASSSSSSNNNSKNITHPDGRRLYERGIVKWHYKNGTVTTNYDLVTPEDGMFTTSFFGKSASSRRNMTLNDTNKQLVATICQVEDNVEEKALSAKISVRRDTSVWKCRTCPGVDEVMIACLAGMYYHLSGFQNGACISVVSIPLD